jgi:hypothetical protein
MKKFSKITNQKINEEPKVDKKIDEAEEFKFKMLDLMEKILRVQSYGPVDNRYLTGKVKIEGKEVLAEALLDLFSDSSNKKQKAILESLKSDIKDWNVIDSKIDSISKDDISLTNKLKFQRMLERYDDESILLFTENNIEKITDKKTLNEYSLLIEKSNLKQETKQNIINIYNYRIDKLS